MLCWTLPPILDVARATPAVGVCGPPCIACFSCRLGGLRRHDYRRDTSFSVVADPRRGKGHACARLLPAALSRLVLVPPEEGRDGRGTPARVRPIGGMIRRTANALSRQVGTPSARVSGSESSTRAGGAHAWEADWRDNIPPYGEPPYMLGGDGQLAVALLSAYGRRGKSAGGRICDPSPTLLL